ncbi:MAG TPA: D-alanine--D-alanine ligase, partial [Flavobacteriales bacterium]|nr:D-alanine--D-alanine ligase [Flavobacteriales bacterium]
MKTVAIITGGNSAEHEISLQSAKVVEANLNKEKFNPIIVHIKEDKWEAIIDDTRLKMDKKDFSFIVGN